MHARTRRVEHAAREAAQRSRGCGIGRGLCRLARHDDAVCSLSRRGVGERCAWARAAVARRLRGAHVCDVVGVLEALVAPEELVEVVVVALARVAGGLACGRLLVHLDAHHAVERRDHAREEPSGGLVDGRALRALALAMVLAHLMEEEAEALGHVAQVGRLAPDEQEERQVGHPARAVGGRLRVHLEVVRPVGVIGEEVAVQLGEAFRLVLRERVGEQHHQVLLLVAHAFLLEAEVAVELLEDALQLPHRHAQLAREAVGLGGIEQVEGLLGALGERGARPRRGGVHLAAVVGRRHRALRGAQQWREEGSSHA
eukprot:2214714-Pleurochrysis_carterae.AAC.4